MMQKRMAQVQEELEERRIEASAGGGMVTAVVSGKQQLISLAIDPRRSIPMMWRCCRIWWWRRSARRSSRARSSPRRRWEDHRWHEHPGLV